MQTITEVSRRIREREVSPVRVVQDCLARIEERNAQLNAFITVLADEALDRAAEAEEEIAKGKWRGALHGIPVAIKDFYDTAGVRTTAAFELLMNRVPAKDAASVARLKDAGAILIGKTNMHRLGMGTTGLESAFGPVRNPIHSEFIPGGSSSGSAAAVAAGMCFATLDTDAIGSCRLPASCCGVVGFKGTYGLVSMQGILEGEQPPDEMIRWLGHAGITTRSVDDTAIVLDALAQQPIGEIADDRPLRAGIASNFQADAEVRAAFERAVETLGSTLVAVPLPPWEFSRGIQNIEKDRQTIASTTFAEIDVLLLPTTTTTTPSVRDAAGHEQALSPANTAFANYYGLPAISIPSGTDTNGLPLGFQIVGKPGDDRTVLQWARLQAKVAG